MLAAGIRSLCSARYVEFSGPLEGGPPPEGVGVFAPWVVRRCGYMLQKHRRVKLEKPVSPPPHFSTSRP